MVILLRLIKRGEEEVLEDGPIERWIFGAKILEQGLQAVFAEQIAGQQAFLLEEPAEDQARKHPNEEERAFGIGVHLGRRDDLPFGDEVFGPEVPVRNLPVETLVEGEGVEALLPCLMQRDEVVDGREFIEVREGKIIEDLQVGADRVGEANILDKRGLLQDVPVGLPFVQAAVDDGEGDAIVMADEDQGRHGERFVDRAGDGRQEGAGIEAGRQFGSEEQIGVDAGAVHGGHVVQHIPLHRQFGIGELK